MALTVFDVKNAKAKDKNYVLKCSISDLIGQCSPF